MARLVSKKKNDGTSNSRSSHWNEQLCHHRYGRPTFRRRGGPTSRSGGFRRTRITQSLWVAADRSLGSRVFRPFRLQSVRRIRFASFQSDFAPARGSGVPVRLVNRSFARRHRPTVIPTQPSVSCTETRARFAVSRERERERKKKLTRLKVFFFQTTVLRSKGSDVRI